MIHVRKKKGTTLNRVSIFVTKNPDDFRVVDRDTINITFLNLGLG